MKRPLCSLLFVLFVLAGTAAAEKLPEIPFEKYTLPNGLQVILHEDHTVPNVTINVWYHVGSKNEKRGKTGLAHLFEHLMFGGSQHFGDPTPLHESLGGDNNASTAEDRTNYFEFLPSNCLELGLWLEADRMGFLLPGLTQEEVNTQKDVVKNERRERIDNQPYAKEYELQLTALYPSDHPYSWPVIGSMEDLSGATIDDARDFFKTYYAPNNASLCVAGDFKSAEVKGLIEKYFGTIPPGTPISRMEAWMPKLDGVKRITAQDKVALPRLYLSWLTPAYYAPDDAELDMLASVLGSGKTSRLYKTLVYDLQIAQDVSVSQDSKELCSSLDITITAKPGHTLEEIEKTVDGIIADVRDKGVTAAELTRAQNDYEADFVRGLQQVSRLADRLNEYNTYIGDPGKFQWDLDRHTSVTPADLQRVAREYLPPDRRMIIYILPQGDLAVSGPDLDRSKKPEVGAEPQFAPPAIQTATLENGLTLMLVEKHTLPLVQMNLLFPNGSGADPQDKFGSAVLTADLLDEGTPTRNALQISEDMLALGADFGTGASYDHSTASLNVLKKNLDKALTIMADVVMHPAFPKEELERKRQLQIGRIQKEASQPASLATKAFSRLMYGAANPYSQPSSGPGSIAAVKAMTRDDLVSFYQKNYSPKGAALVVVGDLTMKEAQAAVEKAFKGWQGAPVTPITPAAPVDLTATKICIVDKPGAPQSVVLMGNAGIARKSADYEACQVFNNALGGIFTSRLNLNLREEKGYTYGINSGFAERRGTSHFRTFAQVQTEYTDESIMEILKELRGITKDKPLTGDELAKSKDNLMKSYPREFETIYGIAGELIPIAAYDLPRDDWTRSLAQIKAVTTESATAAAKAHIHPDQQLIVVVGDRAKIEPEIRKLGLGEITFMNADDLK
jgi:zinc protease